MKTLINNLRRHWMFLIPLFLLLILVFSMWDKNYYFGGDFIFPLKPQDNLQRAMTLWEEQDGGGRYFNYVLFLWEGFFYLLDRINIPSYLSMKILIAVLYILGFICTYYLYLLLFKGTNYANKTSAFLAAIIFTLNPVAVLIVTGTVPLYGFPVCFFFLLKYLKTQNLLYAFPFAFFLNLSFFPDLPQAKLLIVFIIAVFFLLILYSQLQKIALRSLFLPLITLMFITFLLNSFLLIPFLFDSLGQAGLYQQFTKNVIVYQANADIYSASLLYIPRFFNSNLIDKYSPLGHFLSNDFFDLWTFFLEFLAILSTLFLTKKNEKKIIYLLLTALIVFVFIAKGINPPFGEVYKWTLYHIPLAKLFRTTATAIIGATVFYSILVAITLYYLSKKSKWFVGLFLLVHLVIFYPVYTGVKLINGFNLTFNQKGISLPREYFEMGDLLDKSKKDGKVLVLPPNDGYVGKDWGYDGQSLTKWLTSKPLFLSKNGKTEYLDITSFTQLCSFAGLNNIGYLLREKDARGIDVKKKIDFPGNKILENSYFSLNETNDSCFLPHFYIPERTIYFRGNPNLITDLSYLPEYEKKSAIFTYNDQDAKIKTEPEKKAEQQIANNVNYTVIEASSLLDMRLLEKSQFMMSLGYDHLIGDIIYPYVRIDPDSIFYPFVLWKEDNLLKNKKLKGRELLDIQLFLASKRIQEIKRWGITDNTWQTSQKRFQEIMERAIETAADSPDNKNNLELVYEYLQGLKKDLKKIMLAFRFFDREKTKSWENLFFLLEIKTKNRYVINDYDNLIYDFISPKQGIFHGYLLLDKGKPFSDSDAQIKIELNNDKIATYSGKELVGKNVLDFGNLGFNNSANRIKVQIANRENLIDPLQWKIIEKMQAVTLDSGKITFSPGLEVESGKTYGSPVIYQEIKNWKAGSNYLLRIRHVEQKEAALRLQIREEKQIYDKNSDSWIIKKENIIDEDLETKSEGDDFLFLVTADKNSLGASISISGTNGVVKIESAKLEEITIPRVLLVNSSEQPRPAGDLPKINFVKKDSTEYAVAIDKSERPFFLVFSEGFDKRWKIYNNGEEIGEDNHFLVNGYANAWYLKEAGNQKLTIEYWPQRLFSLGWLISSAAFIMLVIYGFFKLKFLKKGKL